MFRIATYNMLKGGSAKVHWTKLLDDHSADILLVQESYCPETHLLPKHAELCENAVWTRVNDFAWGSGIFARHATPEPIKLPDFAGWVVGATVPGPNWMTDTLQLFSIHAPTRRGSYHRAMHEILDMIHGVSGTPDMVIAGDLNIATGERHPTETRKTTNADRKVLSRLYDEFGLINCWQTANPDQPLAQTLRWTGNRTEPYHCDGIFVPGSWRDRLQGCDVLNGEQWDKLSDHNPVIASFE